MDARERAEKIAEAGYEVFADQMFPGYRRWYALESTEKEKFTKAIAAAVRAAYEIDGVEALVMAAEDSLIMYHDADEYDNAQERLRAAAARVREAMGGGA